METTAPGPWLPRNHVDLPGAIVTLIACKDCFPSGLRIFHCFEGRLRMDHGAACTQDTARDALHREYVGSCDDAKIFQLLASRKAL